MEEEKIPTPKPNKSLMYVGRIFVRTETDTDISAS